jgi:hypothetical protein
MYESSDPKLRVLANHYSKNDIIEMAKKLESEQIKPSAIDVIPSATQVETEEHFNPNAYTARQILRQVDIEDEKKYIEEISALHRQRKETAKPEKPQAPKPGSKIAVWFDYYHAMKEANYKMTFRDLAKESGYSANTFKQEHGRYKLERGID